MTDIKENDIIISKRYLTNIPIGTIGTIINVYLEGKAFEVEFIVNDESKVENVLRNQIELYEKG